MIDLATQRGFEQEAKRKDRSVATIADRAPKLCRLYTARCWDDITAVRKGYEWLLSMKAGKNEYFALRKAGRHLEAIAMHATLAALDRVMQDHERSETPLAVMLDQVSGTWGLPIDVIRATLQARAIDEEVGGFTFQQAAPLTGVSPSTLPNIGVRP